MRKIFNFLPTITIIAALYLELTTDDLLLVIVLLWITILFYQIILLLK